MNGRTVFERMTNVRDQFLEEAAFVPQGGTVLAPPRRKSRDNWFTRFANSGWGVACICFVVAVAAVIGMAAWGRMGDMTGPSYGNDPSPRFGYSYELFRYDGTTLDGAVEPGEEVELTLQIQNNGSFLFMQDSDLDGVTVTCVSRKDGSVVWEWERLIPKDGNGLYWVSAGDRVEAYYTLRIPGTAKAGVYDLVISYENSTRTFEGALRVEGNPLVFHTEYQERTTVFEKGQRFAIFTSLQSNGGGIVIRDGVFQECTHIAFIHRGEDGTEYRLLPESTEFYEPSSSRIFTFFIPTDAPAGSYDLYLEAPCYSQTYPHDLTVAEPGEDITVRVAEGAIRNAYGRDIDLSPYTPTVEPTEDGGCTVTFRIYIEGLTGGNSYTVELGEDGRVLGRTATSSGRRLDPFVGLVTSDMIEDAMARLGVSDKTNLSLTVDIDRWLLLRYTAYDEDGNITDHRTERVCREP